ncbi:MAG: lamin tail domain-containing protein [Patescibacteria group bacterium]|nr:lamin tail domain-containing protein [Patescibacteria group bacterium]
MLKRLIIVSIIFGLFLPLSITASQNGVVINSFRISGESSKDEFVEVLNTGGTEINLTGWRLSKMTASGSKSNLLTAFPDIRLAPGKKITIAHPDSSTAYDLDYATTTGTLPSASIAEDNTIILYSDNGKTVVDMVGFGTAKTFEGSPTQNPNDGEIYSRRKGIDTDNNKADFYLSYKPPKKEVEKKTDKKVIDSSPNVLGVARLTVTEFLPNPEGSDGENEFIEIYNAGARANISGYYITDLLGSPKKYKIPEGTVIDSGSYLAFFSKKTPISLNNDGDGAAVLDPNGNEINASPDDCGKAPEGASYAYNGKSWVFTGTPTPGRKNIIEAVKEDSKESGEVLSMIDDSELPTEEEALVAAEERAKNDQVLGYSLIILATLGGIAYTLYENKEKVIEVTNNKFRGSYDRFRERLREARERE